jgi:hypothetical protein
MKRFAAALVLLPAHIVSGGESNGHELGWLAGCWVSADATWHEVRVAESEDRLTASGWRSLITGRVWNPELRLYLRTPFRLPG